MLAYHTQLVFSGYRAELSNSRRLLVQSKVDVCELQHQFAESELQSETGSVVVLNLFWHG